MDLMINVISLEVKPYDFKADKNIWTRCYTDYIKPSNENSLGYEIGTGRGAIFYVSYRPDRRQSDWTAYLFYTDQSMKNFMGIYNTYCGYDRGPGLGRKVKEYSKAKLAMNA